MPSQLWIHSLAMPHQVMWVAERCQHYKNDVFVSRQSAQLKGGWVRRLQVSRSAFGFVADHEIPRAALQACANNVRNGFRCGQQTGYGDGFLSEVPRNRLKV
jgi:hypothetical protein